MRYYRRFSMILLPLAGGFTGFLLGWVVFRGGVDPTPLTKGEQKNSELRSSLEKLRVDNTAPQADAQEAQVLPQGRSQPVPVQKYESSMDDLKELAVLRETLASANRSIAEHQAHAMRLQTELDQAREDHKRLAAMESELTEQLESSRRFAVAHEAALKKKTEQLALLETSTNPLREEAHAARQKVERHLQASAQMQEIFRRREAYLTALTNRYQEITEQFRAFASVLENRSGPVGTPSAGVSLAGPELARIRNTIAMAEEELRQLNSLNARALQIQKTLTAK
jgi:chromosome segregation ATPase